MYLSFIIPIYNSEKYLEECLTSLFSQDISEDDYEVICVDDGSSDNSHQIVENFSHDHKNINYLYKINGGVSSARNEGLKHAMGKYIWFVDADDIIKRNCLFEIASLVSSDVYDVIQFGAYVFTDTFSKTEMRQYVSNKLPVTSYAYNVFVTRNIFRRSFVQEHSILFESTLKSKEDIVFISDFYSYGCNQYLLDSAIYYYRIHSNSLVDNENNYPVDYQIDLGVYVFSRVCEDYWRANNTYSRYIIARNLVLHICSTLYSSCYYDRKHFRKAFQIYWKAGLFMKNPPELKIGPKVSFNKHRWLFRHINNLFVYRMTRFAILLKQI